MANILHKYIHEYDFDALSILGDKFDDILDKSTGQEGQFGVYEDNSKFPQVYGMFEDIIKKNYTLGERLMDPLIWVYSQTNMVTRQQWHNSVENATIVGMTCLNPPEEGANIEFIIDGIVAKVICKPKKLYLFPYWIYINIAAQESEQTTLFLNMKYLSETRCQHIDSKVIW